MSNKPKNTTELNTNPKFDERTMNEIERLKAGIAEKQERVLKLKGARYFFATRLKKARKENGRCQHS